MLKCIIWDLDNTIWNGTLLEDSEVTINETIIKLIEQANKKGIIQSIASKNIYEHTMCKIKQFKLEDYFIYPQITFNPKSSSIKKIIQDLHFRAEDVLFIDDLESELEEVKYNIKGILAINVKEFEKIRQIIQENSDLSTQEALNRINAYKIEEHRIVEQLNYDDISEFLQQSNFTIHLEEAKLDDLSRIKELIDRTHQLNTTGISYSIDEITDMIYDDKWKVIIGVVEDKYGNYGKSVLMIANVNNNSFNVKIMIVSCRLLNKGVTNYLLGYGYKKAKMCGCHKYCIDFHRNEFNRSMLAILQMNSMKKIEHANSQYTYWGNVNEFENPIKIPAWIREI